MTRVTTAFVVFLLLAAGIIVLQILFSKGESKWPGLVFPTISFLLALLYPLNMAAPAGSADAGFLVQMAVVWLIANIPTIVLLAIYFACREKYHRNRQLEKMNIQDL